MATPGSNASDKNNCVSCPGSVDCQPSNTVVSTWNVVVDETEKATSSPLTFYPPVTPDCDIESSSHSNPIIRKCKRRHSSLTARAQRQVTFDSVQIYHFQRSQGFICIPSQGGSTLGMAAKHWTREDLSVSQHQWLRRRERQATLHRYCLEGKLVLSPNQLRLLERNLPPSPIVPGRPVENETSPFLSTSAVENSSSPLSSCGSIHAPDNSTTEDVIALPVNGCPQSACDSQSHLPDIDGSTYLLPQQEVSSALAPAIINATSDIFPTCDSKSSVDWDNDVDDEALALVQSLEEYYFLQPLSIKRRRILLRKAGLQRIDRTEKAECVTIRSSRITCGCNCPNGDCLPATCQCAQNGISCQVDRPSFPCACISPSQCNNPAGRIEFNPLRVRTHYLHTGMRLEMERQPEGSSLKRLCMMGDRPLPNFGSMDRIPNDELLFYNEVKSQDLPKQNVLGSPATDPVDGMQESDLAEPKAGHSNSISGTILSATQGPTFEFDGDNEAVLAIYNTTAYGGCRDCQNDRYVHVLMQELAQQQSSELDFSLLTETTSDVSAEDLEDTDHLRPSTTGNESQTDFWNRAVTINQEQEKPTVNNISHDNVDIGPHSCPPDRSSDEDQSSSNAEDSQGTSDLTNGDLNSGGLLPCSHSTINVGAEVTNNVFDGEPTIGAHSTSEGSCIKPCSNPTSVPEAVEQMLSGSVSISSGLVNMEQVCSPDQQYTLSCRLEPISCLLGATSSSPTRSCPDESCHVKQCDQAPTTNSTDPTCNAVQSVVNPQPHECAFNHASSSDCSEASNKSEKPNSPTRPTSNSPYFEVVSA